MGKAYDKLKEYHGKNIYKFEPAEIHETLRECCKHLHSEKVTSLRWVDVYFNVVELDGVLIGYQDYQTTGDNSPSDCGYEFDPDSICDVEKIEETKVVVTYKKI